MGMTDIAMSLDDKFSSENKTYRENSLDTYPRNIEPRY